MHAARALPITVLLALSLALPACSATGEETAVGGTPSATNAASAPAAKPVADTATEAEAAAAPEGPATGHLNTDTLSPARAGGSVGSQPESIGPFRLLTEDLVDELGIQCTEMPKRYDDEWLFPDASLSTASVAYVHPNEIDVQQHAGNNCNLDLSLLDPEAYPGVITITFTTGINDTPKGLACDQVDSHIFCAESYENTFSIFMQMSTYASPYSSPEYLASFYKAYTGHNHLVREQIGLPGPYATIDGP